MFFKMLAVWSLSICYLFSYDKIDVVSYKEDDNFSKAKSMSVYDDKLYVLVPPKILVYTSTLSLVNSIDIKVEQPVSFIVYKNKFYVLDQKKCEIRIFDKDGNVVYRFGGCGSQDNSLSMPQDIKVFDSKIFVADRSKINVYTEDGIFLYSFNTFSKDRTKLYSPNLISFDPEGFLNIFDKKNQVIVRYDYLGNVEKEYSKKDFPGVITSDGFVYTGSDDGKIREYDLDFNLRGVFGTKGKNRYEFQGFNDIKAYKNGIFILDSRNKKIVYLRIENKVKKNIQRKIYFKDDILVKPFRVDKIDGFVFNINDNGNLIFFSPKKGSEGIYLYDGTNTTPILLGYKKNFLTVDDIGFLDGKIYILDSSDYKVKVFYNNENMFSFGNKLGFLSDTKEARFSQPVRMTISSLENVYVLDAKLKYIQVFNKDGVFLYFVDLSKSINERIVDLFVKDNNELIVLSNRSIFYFAFDGKVLNKFDLKNVGSALSFCSDFMDYIFILDATGRIVVYDFSGNYIASFGSKGVGDFDFSNPYMIRCHNKKIYISETSGKIISFDVNYFSHPLNFEVFYDTTSSKVNFKYHVNNEKYTKELYVEKSTDAINFKRIAEFSDGALIHSTTIYYRLKTLSVTGNESFSDIKSIFIGDDRKQTKTQLISRPPLEITPLNLDYIFAANYKYYFSNPIGKILVKNNTSNDFENLKLSFFIKEYMDFSYDVVIDSLSANSQKEVPINAALNNKILSITETTPIQARLTLQYYLDTQEKEVSLNIPIKILSRNSMVWDDPRRLANFITVKDPVISDISKMIASKKDDISSDIDDNIKTFSLFYRYLSSLGLKYVEDPVTPYSLSRSSRTIIDTVQYPRNLLKIRAGDCDDLTVLFVSMLEGSGIETVLMDFGDHITAMFELKKEKISDIGVSDDMIIEYNGKYYVPFEVTLLNKDVYSSIDYAIKEYKLKKDIVKFYPVREMLSIYEPPTFTEDVSLQLSLPQELVEETQKDIDLIEKKYYEYYESYYKSILSQEPDNYDIKIKLATIYAITSRYDEAKKIFEEVIEEFPANSVALNNLANIYHINSDFKKAAEFYERAHQADPYDADILVNYARNAIKMNKKEEAKLILEKAARINPDIKKIEKNILEEK